MGLLLESRTGTLESTAPTEVGQAARLWASSPHSVKGEEWGQSFSCFRRLERGTFAFPTAAGADLAVTPAQLAMILGGLDPVKARQRHRFNNPR